jgi:hypothetical protein
MCCRKHDTLLSCYDLFAIAIFLGSLKKHCAVVWNACSEFFYVTNEAELLEARYKRTASTLHALRSFR